MATPGARTGFLGLSHLGINYGVAWSSFGQPVLGFDLDAATVDRLSRGELPVYEPGLPELLESSSQWIAFSADLSLLGACQLVVVAQDVPTDSANGSDLDPVLKLIDAAVPHLRSGVTIAVMSQVPPGFMRQVGERLRAARPGLTFQLYYWVETLVFGDAVRRALHPERLIVGCADPSGPLPAALEEGLRRYDCPILTMSYESAEITKMAINLYLVGSVTYANTVADLCEVVGADWSEIVPALRLDARIGPAAYLRPSLGVAGGNLERDLVTLRGLCAHHDVDATYLDALIDYNARRLDWALRKLHEHVLDRELRPTIGIWGLTYKKDTRSTKNSPSLRVIADLEGRAELRAFDPAIRPGELDSPARVVADPNAVLDNADCLLIMADWERFAAADLATLRRKMRRTLVLDCVGVLEGRRGEMAGIEYVSMGRGR